MASDPVAAGFSSLIAKMNAVVAQQQKLAAALGQPYLNVRKLIKMANSGLQNAQAAVAALQTLQTTVIAEIQALTAAAGDPDASVQTLADQINASVSAIQAAIPPAPAAAITTPQP